LGVTQTIQEKSKMTCSNGMDKYYTRGITDGLKRTLNWSPEGRKRRRPKMKGKKETKSVLKQKLHSKTANMTESDKEPVTGVTGKPVTSVTGYWLKIDGRSGLSLCVPAISVYLLMKGRAKILPRTGHEGPAGKQGYSPTRSLTSALGEGGWSTPHP
jgi:hypothetical protein